MDVVEAVRTILAVRRYQDRPVPEASVRRIVEAGRLTGSAMNVQPWHVIVIQDRDTLRKLGALARTGPYIAEAPLATVVAVDKSRFAVSDASRAIQSMLLTAWADGVGSNWVGFGGPEDVKALLNIPHAGSLRDPSIRVSRSESWDAGRNSARRSERSPIGNGSVSRLSKPGWAAWMSPAACTDRVGVRSAQRKTRRQKRRACAKENNMRAILASMLLLVTKPLFAARLSATSSSMSGCPRGPSRPR